MSFVCGSMRPTVALVWNCLGNANDNDRSNGDRVSYKYTQSASSMTSGQHTDEKVLSTRYTLFGNATRNRSTLSIPSRKITHNAATDSFQSIFEVPNRRSSNTIGVSSKLQPTRRQR